MSYPPGPGGGQPPHGQPPYGQPPQGEPSYGQPPYGHSPQGSYPGQEYGGPPPHQPYAGPPGPRPGVPAWVWIVAGVGVFAIVLLIVFLVLTRPSDSPPLDVSVSSSSDYAGSANMAGNLSGGSAPASAVTRAWVSGKWGPACPTQETSSIRFEPNGAVQGSGMSGTWTLSGNTVTTVTGGRSESSNWVYVSQDEARVTVPGVGTSTLRRCAAAGVPATGGTAPPADASLTPARLLAGSITGADYPASAIRAGAQGTTTVSIQIGVDGRVTGCSVTASSGNSALDSATCSLIHRRYRYAPATRNGQPVASSTTQSISWSPPT